MPDQLSITLNSDGPNTIHPESPSFKASGDFDIVFQNQGPALHVYVHLDSDLSEAATLETTNRFVEDGGLDRVRVAVDEAAIPVRGRLKIVTGYGSTTEYITLSLAEPETKKNRVEVDETLAQPQTSPDRPLVSSRQLPLVILSILAVLVAVLVFFIVRDPILVFGVLAVLVGVLVAGVLVTRES